MRIGLLIAVVLLAACTEGPQASVVSETKAMNRPDRTYRLSAEERKILSPQIDADALEEFLQMHSPAQRASLLKGFQIPVVRHGEPAPNVTVLTRVSDPTLQKVLDKVWAPRWAHLSLEELEREDQNQPGVQAALAKKRSPRGGGQ